jgi:UDP-2,4-diacetamido-2,4,6-trideoxy-beta-L-altropyranose hydrolase
MAANYLIDRPFRAIFLLAKFGPTIGLGHAMRSLAFCASIRKRHRKVPILWLTNGSNNEAHALANSAGINPELTVQSLDIPLETLSAGTLKDFAQSLKLRVSEALMIVDVYDVPQESWRNWIQTGASILAIDDFANPSVLAHGILNHGTDLQSLYSDWHRGLTALGASYGLLREPFASFPKPKAEEKAQVFISLGGSQMLEALKRLLELLLDNPSLSTYNFAIISKQALDPTNFSIHHIDVERISFLIDPAPEAMLEAFDSAALCITSASTTAYEVCARKRPLVVIETVDNQRQLRQYLDKSGLALSLSVDELANAGLVQEVLAKALKSESQAHMLEVQSHLFDGHQAARHADFAEAVWKDGQTLHIRKADANDTELTFTWANDLETRAAAFTQEPIPWETHKAYFQSKIADNEYHWYIISRDIADSLAPIGQVRFAWTILKESYATTDAVQISEGHNHCWTISYLVAPDWRGQRLAVPLLAVAIQQLRAEGRTEPLLALVKLSNVASLKAFEALGFVDVIPLSETEALMNEAQEPNGVRYFWLSV